MNKKCVAITGGTGYIGSRIANYLIDQNYEIIILSRKTKSDLPEKLKKVINVVSYENQEELISVLKPVHSIIHLMSLNEIEAVKTPDKAAYVNVYLTELVLQAAIKANVSRFIYFSTVHVYGSPLSGQIDETQLTLPSHPYSVVHRAAEDFINEKIITNKMDGAIFRLSNGFGAPVYKSINRWTLLINDICRQAVENNSIKIRNKNQVRDFIAIEDIEKVLDLFLQRDKLSQDCIYNLSSNIATSIGEMATLVAGVYKELSSKEIEIRYENEDVNSIILNINNRKLIQTGVIIENNFKEEIKNTLRKCIEWFGKN